MNKLLWWMLLAGLALIFSPLQVFAEASTTVGFTPPSTDYSMTYLENLFGSVDGVLYGTGSQMMGAIFKVFNGAVLALGGIVITYTLLVGTMNTAQEGKMLGQKWSSIWVPIRSTIGLALLLPKASGYCLMQIFVMWIIVQGVGAADKVWNAALDYLNAGGVIIRANINTETGTSGDTNAISTGALAMLGGEACMIGLQKELETLRQSYLDAEDTGGGACSGEPSADMQAFCDTPVPDFIATFDAVKFQTDNASATSFSHNMPYFDDGTAYTYLNGICGHISWNALPQSTLEDINGSISGLSNQDMASTALSRATAIQQMYLDLTPTAQLMVDNDPMITPTTNTNPAYPDVATKVFGVPYLSSSDTVCTKQNNDCVLWGGAYGSDGKTMSAAIFQGDEIDNAVAVYNGVMASTVELINDANNSTNWENGRDFIDDAKNNGWLTAGSYFFDLVYLNGSASASTETDTGTGLDGSKSTPSLLLKGFDTDAGCKAHPTDGSPDYIKLCVWYQKDSSDMADVQRLVDNGSGAAQPSTTITADTKAISGQAASTVYGFVQNALLMVQPEEPPMEAPAFTMNFNFEFESSLFSLPEKDFDCGSAWAGGKCVGRMIADAIYNKMILGIFNYLVLGFSQLMGLVLLASFALPLHFFSEVFINGMEFISDPGANPIVSLANMGTAYINYSVQMWIDLFTICVAMVLIPVFGPLLLCIGIPFIMITSPLLIAWSGVLIAIGFSTAYYVPVMPYMLFIFGVIGWLMAVIEAMVAAPIVALGMTHPEGDGALGKADQAIMILMNVFLRPAMMIIGYLAGIALCYVSIWILNSGFQHVMQFIQGEADGSGGWSSTAWKGGEGYTNWAGLYGFFFSVLIYTTLYLTLAQKAFDLIFTLPDHIMTWIGGPASQVGEKTAQWGEETKGKVTEGGKETMTGMAQSAKKAKGAAEMAGRAALAVATEGASEGVAGGMSGGGDAKQ